jgi:4'-phosphopantetheinyl transferase
VDTQGAGWTGSSGLAVRIDAVRVDQPVEEPVFATLLQAVSADRRSRVLRFHRRIDAQRSLFAELLLREVITKRRVLPREAVAFDADQNGKPRLASESGFHFNVSHSGDWVVCATGSLVVGVDVERIRPRVPDVLDRVLSKPERDQFECLDEAEQRRFFFTRWAVKEAFSKALGQGVGLPFHEITLVMELSGVIRFLRDGRPVADAACRTFHLDSGHAAATCVVGGEAPASAQIWDPRTIVDRVSALFPPEPY